MEGLDTIKIYGINTAAFITSVSSVDFIFKAALVVASFTYTVAKISVLIKENFKKENFKKDQDEE